MNIRLIHAADLHLDSPFEGLSEEKAALRRSEQRALLQKLGQIVQEREAQLVLLSGDLLDSDNAYAETASMLSETLAAVRVPVFIAPGNHDWYSRRSPYASLALPENVHIFREAAICPAELPALRVRVWGAGYTAPSCPDLLSGFTIRKETGWKDILVLHGHLGAASSPYCPIREEELAASGADYAALGHVHSYSGLRRAGNTYYAWPGCAEGRGFDECGQKGVIFAELSDSTCHAELIPIAAREYRVLSVPVGDDPVESVLRSIPEGAERDIYKIILTGETNAPVAVSLLRQRLEPYFFALRIEDKTVPAVSLSERASENSLSGIFIRRMLSRIESASDDAERELLQRALRYGLAALSNGEAVL